MVLIIFKRKERYGFIVYRKDKFGNLGREYLCFVRRIIFYLRYCLFFLKGI